jgi:hypothetical protein
VDRLERMARSSPEKSGPRATFGWIAGLVLVIAAGMAVAGVFFVPGLALAAAFSSGATGAHVWVVDGGPEVATNLSWRVEIMIEDIAIGLVALFVALRYGRTFLLKLQDWYEGESMRPRAPLVQPVPAVIMPRPGHGRVPANDRRRELNAA